MPIHELIRLLMSGGAYFDRVSEGENGNPPAARRRESENDGDGEEDDGPDSEEPIADLRAAKRRLAEYEKYVTKLRRENANYRGKSKSKQEELDEANAKLAALQKKYDTDTEAMKADHAKAVKVAVDTALAERDQSTKQERITAALKAEAQKIGAKDVDDLLKIIDASGITVDDKGAVVGVEKLLGDTKTAKPHLFGATSTSTSTQQTPPPAKEGGKSAKDMTPDEYNAAKAAFTGMPVAQRFSSSTK